MFSRTKIGTGSVLFGTLLLAGCSATLDRDECVHAEWRMIGYEDGSSGKRADYIGRHREACAEHHVTPDMAAYMRGRNEGLAHYCRPQNGYRLGRTGVSYSGICPDSLESEFVSAYRYGKDIYKVEYQINRALKEEKSKSSRLKKINEQMKNKEMALVGDGISFEHRLQLLMEIKELSEERGSLESEINALGRKQVKLRERLNHLTQQSPYS